METDPPCVLRIQLFGGPTVTLADGQVIAIPEKPGGVLTLLALRANHRCNRDELLEAIWPDELPDSTRGRLRTALSYLRRTLANGHELISAGSSTVVLNVSSAVELDTREFDELIDKARHAPDIDQQIDLLSRACQISKDPLAPRIFVDEVIRAREMYEIKREEARRTLKAQMERRDASRPIAPAPSSESSDESYQESHAEARPAAVLTNLLRRQPSEARPRRRSRLAVSLAFLGLVAIALAVLAWWMRPAPTRQQRIASLRSLRHAPSSGESPAGLSTRMEKRYDELIALAEEACKAWDGAGELQWIEALRPLYEDIESVTRWLLERDPARAVRLVGALSPYWRAMRKEEVAKSFLDDGLKRTPDKSSREYARARVLHAAYTMESVSPRTDYAHQKNERGLAEVNEARRLYQRLSDERGLAKTTRLTAHFIHALGDDDKAESTFEEALAQYRVIGDLMGQALTYWGMSLLQPSGMRADEYGLRSLRLALMGVRLAREAGNVARLDTAFDEMTNYVKGFLGKPRLSSRPEAILLLQSFADECRERLKGLGRTTGAQDALVIRKILARVEMRLDHRSAAIEQLGHLLGPEGDRRLTPERGRVELLKAYIRYLPEAENPPLSTLHAQQDLDGFLQSQRTKWAAKRSSPPLILSLEAAIELACR